jgi:imidazolonepropionase-like amidohydrolase
MLTRKLTVLVGAALCLVAFANAAWSKPQYAHKGPTIITGVRVIDGLGNAPKENQDIVLENGKISGIGPSGSLKAPKGALKIDGKGLSAMPGLIDLHIHTQGGWANGQIPGERYAVGYKDAAVQQRLSGYVYAGVTTVLDTGADHKWIVKTRDRINNGELFGPRHFTTGVAWSQKPSGWDAGNTSGGDWASSTIVSDVADIPDQVARYKKDGIEILKLYAGMGTVGMQALIAEADKQGMQTIADLWMLNLNRQISQTTGLTGWAHTGGFNVAPMEDHKWMAKNKRFVISTIILGEFLSGNRVGEEKGSNAMLKEPLIVDIWGTDEVEEFYRVYPEIREAYYEGPSAFYQLNGFGDLSVFRSNMQENVRRAIEAGVLVGCGTDDVYASGWTGESTHREMKLMAMAGIEPLKIIKACTSDAAKILRRENEFGSLQPGLSADLLLVEGNPAENIDDTRNVREVFMRGNQVDRNSLKLKK